MNQASWLSDPMLRHQLRYWNGGSWTEHVSDSGTTGVDPIEAANWIADPSGRHHFRYWDGVRWSDHVADNGVSSIDPPDGNPVGAVHDDGGTPGRLPLRDNRAGPVVHPLDVLLHEDYFPRRGDKFDMGGIEMPILVERDELPADAVDMAGGLLAVHQIEPTHDHAVEATSVVVRSIVQILGGTFPTKSDDVVHWGESAGPDFETLRAVFADVERGADLVDFELLKVLSLLSSPMSPILGIDS